MVTLKEVIEGNNTWLGKIFDVVLQLLIIISLISFSIQTMPNLSIHAMQMCRAVEIVAVAIFTVEYFLRIMVADCKQSYIFSFWGVIDICSILPFYLTMGLDFLALRALRLLRLIRLFKLARYNKAAYRFNRAFHLAKEEIILLLITMIIVLYIAAVGIYHFEHQAQPQLFSSVFNGLWWAVSSLTTVGYGDVYPITIGGKIFTFFVLIIGLGVITIPAGLFASALSRVKEEELDKFDL